MAEGKAEIANCDACGSPMDVSEVGPFTKVECPSCRKHTRVKREFGPYTLTRRHAIGGMSMVFVAQDNTLQREVVLKILSEEYSADEKRIAAFEEEARITASIGHPHVVRVFTTGRAFGRFFIAMEFIQGGHYEHHIREKGSVPEAEALPLMIEVAEGLKAAHAAGLIHRDIKPGNILLDSHGRAKIVDFGLALLTHGGMAQAEEIWATPYYVPPETIEGLPEDFRSDVYAFGATFHHALAGKPPCNEESMDTNRLRKAKQHIPPLASVAPRLSKATCAVVDRCMAYRPEKRFASYEELIAALRTAQTQLGSLPAVPLTGHPRVGSSKRAGSGKGDKAGLVVAALLVLVASAFAWKWYSQRNGERVQGGKEVVISHDSAPGNDGAGGLRVASAYREAREALSRGDYEKARELFGEVRDDPNVLEPTGSWAACEAVAASYLEGRSEQARDEARRALDHVNAAIDLPAGTTEIFKDVLRRLSEPQSIKPGNFDEGTGPRYLSWLLSGLKNWEQGMADEAVSYFEALVNSPVKGSNAWMAPYSKLAGDYLADYASLKKGEPKDFNLSKADAEGLIVELRALQASLRTKGRARFNVRSWQLDLEKGLRVASGGRVLANDDGDSTFPQGVMADLAACRFGKAVGTLKAWRPSDEDQKSRRDAMLTLAEAATTFLAELGERAVDRSDIELVSRDGRRFQGILRGDVSTPLLKSAQGGVSVSWSEIEPDSLIALHRVLSQSESGEIDKLRRHEEAIAFDLLAGDRERGKEAGSRLAEVSEPFERRWVAVLPALDR